jgi:hypothetical protein
MLAPRAMRFRSAARASCPRAPSAPRRPEVLRPPSRRRRSHAPPRHGARARSRDPRTLREVVAAAQLQHAVAGMRRDRPPVAFVSRGCQPVRASRLEPASGLEHGRQRACAPASATTCLLARLARMRTRRARRTGRAPPDHRSGPIDERGAPTVAQKRESRARALRISDQLARRAGVATAVAGAAATGALAGVLARRTGTSRTADA